MKLATLLLLALAGRARALQAGDAKPAGDDAAAAGAAAVGRLADSARQELDRSTRELAALRDQIAAEKLPLAQELTASEEKLAQLRAEHDRVARLVDAGNLELPRIRAEIKAREDELSYLGNFLDQYARTLESKVNVCELQYLGNAIDTAKQATENTTLSMTEKFDRQVDFVRRTIQRLFDVIGGMRFKGEGVDMHGMLAKGSFAILGPVALFCGSVDAAAGANAPAAASGANAPAAIVAGLVVPQTGSSHPLIRPLEGAIGASIAALVEKGEGTLPFDPSRGGALKALVQKTSLLHIFEKGGPIMWPLLAASVLALDTVLERVFFLMRERMRRDPDALESFFASVDQGDVDGAIAIGRASNYYVVRALGYALAHKERSLASAVLYAQAQEIKRFRRGVPILDTVITLAPLLGLLGTVTGMMSSFSLIGGELSAPGAITGGIAEALIATAFGLGIAITSLLPFNFLNARTEEARHELESAATQLELMVRDEKRPSAERFDASAIPVEA